MPDRPEPDQLGLPVPPVLIERLADLIAQRLAPLLAQPAAAESPWLDFERARAYLGFSRDALYKLTAAGALPCRKKAGGQGLRFHRSELDHWMNESYPRVDRLG